jgi:acylphosphatase
MNYNIVGTVQNVDDYVEIYAQGDDADIERFIQGCHLPLFSILY